MNRRHSAMDSRKGFFSSLAMAGGRAGGLAAGGRAEKGRRGLPSGGSAGRNNSGASEPLSNCPSGARRERERGEEREAGPVTRPQPSSRLLLALPRHPAGRRQHAPQPIGGRQRLPWLPPVGGPREKQREADRFKACAVSAAAGRPRLLKEGVREPPAAAASSSSSSLFPTVTLSHWGGSGCRSPSRTRFYLFGSEGGRKTRFASR